MSDLTPRQSGRPLLWDEVILDLQDLLTDVQMPVYIVGGAVRDAYLHRPIKDIDLVTPGDSLGLTRQIANRMNGDYFPLDPERGVGRALVPRAGSLLTVDVAQFRGANLLEDLQDRDFTLNAMAVNLHGDLQRLIDPLNAEQDITQKLLRRCSPHALTHDPIRTLRAVRQSLQFSFRIEPETIADIRAAAPLLKWSSPERIRDEIINILAMSKAAAALRIMERFDLTSASLPPIGIDNLAVSRVERLHEILAVISPKRTEDTAASFDLGMFAIQLDRYRAKLQEHVDFTWANDRPHRALLALAALLRQHAKADVEQYAETIRLSNAERQRLLMVTQNHSPTEALTPLVLHRFWRKMGAAGVDICLVMLADYLAQASIELNQDAWLEEIERARVLLEAYYEQHDRIVEPPVLLNGEELITALSLRPGPRIGKLLDAIREAQVTGEVLTAADALNFARVWLNQS
jgi:tRNA nucleotidyltransferase/poly(A) polymerase